MGPVLPGGASYLRYRYSFGRPAAAGPGRTVNTRQDMSVAVPFYGGWIIRLRFNRHRRAYLIGNRCVEFRLDIRGGNRYEQ